MSRGPEMSDSVTINGITITLDDVARFAPIVTFHRDEQYFPLSIEYLAQNCDILRADGSTYAVQPSLSTLASETDASMYLALYPAAINGVPPDTNNNITVPMYVCPQVPADASYVDLTFFALYGYNGPQSVYCRPPVISNFDCKAPTFAEHQGDLEQLTVRVDNTLSRMISIRLEAHGDDFWESPASGSTDLVSFAHRHVLVRAAVSAHGTYNGHDHTFPGRITLDDQTIDIGIGRIGVEIVDLLDPFPYAASGTVGAVWQPFALDGNNNEYPNGQLVFVGLESNGQGGWTPITEQTWITFPGRFGSAQTNSFAGVEEFPSEPISGAQENIGNTIGNLAEQFGLIPDDDVHGNGPSPFIGRPTMDVNNPYNPPLTHDLVWSVDHLIPNADHADGLSGSPAAAVFNDVLWLVHEGRGDNGWMSAALYTDDGGWGPDHSIPNDDNAIGTSGGPGLAVFNDLLFIIHEGQGNDGWLWCSTVDVNGNFSPDLPIPNGDNAYGTTGTPAVVVFRNLLYVIRADRGGSSVIKMACFDGSNWISDVALPFSLASETTPTACVYEDELWVFYQDESFTFNYATWDGTNWTSGAVPNNQYGTSGSGCCVFDERLFLLSEQAGNTGWICGCVYSNGVWSPDVMIPNGSSAYGTSGAPALISYSGLLWIFRQGQGNSGWMWAATAWRAY